MSTSRCCSASAAYEDVMRAYVRAMRRRHADDLPLDRHSVASFFESRVQTPQQSCQAARRSWSARTCRAVLGLANARAAYQAFRRVSSQRVVRRARAAGRPVQ